jgi:hypothetical protein
MDIGDCKRLKLSLRRRAKPRPSITRLGEAMKPAAPLAPPLSEAEIEELDDFLGSESPPEEAMDVLMMDGFIAASPRGRTS